LRPGTAPARSAKQRSPSIRRRQELYPLAAVEPRPDVVSPIRLWPAFPLSQTSCPIRDITYLRSPVRGVFYYLYLVVDIFSRKVVAWRVHDVESPDLASDLVESACTREGVLRHSLVLHADNGGPMEGSTMLATLQRLGVVASFSRPSVSDDNRFPRLCSERRSIDLDIRKSYLRTSPKPQYGLTVSFDGTILSIYTPAFASCARATATKVATEPSSRRDTASTPRPSPALRAGGPEALATGHPSAPSG
jgi:transposase InsO family protein